MKILHAILLLGPTGSGKTPLGDCLAAHGFRGHRCAHFDFGAELRRAALAEPSGSGLTANQQSTVRRSLQTGALLEDDDFPIAAALLRRFAASHRLGPDDRIILNGLPRHAGQAKAVDRLLRVEAVISLDAAPEVIRSRIACDSGGDRAGRVDDTPDAVAAKLKIFHARTIPLLDHYRAKGVSIRPVPVEVQTGPDDILRILDGNP